MAKIPQLEINDVVDIKSLSHRELQTVPFDEKFWICGIGICIHKTTIRDYGIHPFYYWNPKKIWIDVLREFFYCGSCAKKYGKLIKKDKPIPEPVHCMWPVTKEELPFMITDKIKKQ